MSFKQALKTELKVKGVLTICLEGAALVAFTALIVGAVYGMALYEQYLLGA